MPRKPFYIGQQIGAVAATTLRLRWAKTLETSDTKIPRTLHNGKRAEALTWSDTASAWRLWAIDLRQSFSSLEEARAAAKRLFARLDPEGTLELWSAFEWPN